MDKTKEFIEVSSIQIVVANSSVHVLVARHAASIFFPGEQYLDPDQSLHPVMTILEFIGTP
jgi:hypothetical protein